MELLIDGNQGIYIPQQFAKQYGQFMLKAGLKEEMQILLNGPDDDLYWQVWDEVIDSLEISIGGIKHTLYENGDLWLIAEDEEIPEF